VVPAGHYNTLVRVLRVVEKLLERKRAREREREREREMG